MLYGPEHVAEYQRTGGEVGHEWNGTVVLLLTTKGRVSGEPRTTPLIYQQDGDAYVIVASKGGAEDDPQWYKNLRADDRVTVQVRDDVFEARARTAADEERPRLWSKMTATWPAYDEYQTKTDRTIPVVVLERV
ncbi:nitroreductase family deazaflavin-dependent oxidoreductase [Actinomadura atramentaria]|uniref:nitroreductase family deazaflavin-dependent oxidoreductase n=1 Tax=Actinomadura atramentaria TaxID=1990 RepID=UPI00036B1C35|nr:nitroreductase family deazaflavin-dependent oxidoreductase [Actinomadura atramentaria]